MNKRENRGKKRMKLNRVREVRKQKKITQEELASEVGCSKEIIDEIEVGRVTTGHVLACKISFALEIDIHILFPLEYSRK